MIECDILYDYFIDSSSINFIVCIKSLICNNEMKPLKINVIKYHYNYFGKESLPPSILFSDTLTNILT